MESLKAVEKEITELSNILAGKSEYLKCSENLKF